MRSGWEARVADVAVAAMPDTQSQRGVSLRGKPFSLTASLTTYSGIIRACSQIFIVSDALETLKGAVHPSREFDVQVLISPIDKVRGMKLWGPSRFVDLRLHPTLALL